MTPDLQEALRLHQQGRLAEAMAAYQAILKAHPADADALHYLGVACRQGGRTEEAIGLLRQSLAIRPSAPMVHNNLGNAYLSQGRLAEALACFDRAIELAPQYAMAHNNRGVVLSRLDRAEEALGAYREVARLEPGNADAHYNMGVVQQELGRFDAAAQAYRLAVERAPGFFEAWVNRADVLIRGQQFEAALAAADAALRLQPQSPEAHHNRGLALAGLRRFAEAQDEQGEATRLRPDYAPAWIARGNLQLELRDPDAALQSFARGSAAGAPARLGEGRALIELKRFEASLGSLEAALALEPENALAWLNRGYACSELQRHDEALRCIDKGIAFSAPTAQALSHRGNALFHLGRLEEAVESHRRALGLDAAYAGAHSNLGIVLLEQGAAAAAVECFRAALALQPRLVPAHIAWGNAEQVLGHPQEALKHYEQALSVEPDHALAYSNRLFVLAYNVLGSAREYLQLARGWERAVIPQAVRATARQRKFGNPARADRRLRVGYVSADLRTHALSYFVERLFACHDRSRVEVHAYHTHHATDAVTVRLRGLVDRWTNLAGVADGAARDRIEADGIDVLVDLTGHTAGGRLGIFAHRAAPVQTHYLGYFASTGLTEMDYWIGDGEITPATGDADFSECVWRLPRVWVGYDSKEGAPPVERRPREDGAVTLGSFNSLRKLTPATLALWARILRELPAARLLLKTRELAEAQNRRHLLQVMHEAGVDAERIELLDGSTTSDWRSHMDCYNAVDIALDPVGAVGGGTTTCDALWMAVPLVTLAGDRMASRMTASMLAAIGHPEWIAQDEEQYVAKVLELARDPGARAALRAAGRREMAQSALCDGGDLTRRLEDAYIEMFDRWKMDKR